MNINDIKTKEDFEFVAIKYDPANITEAQKEKINNWVCSITGQPDDHMYFTGYNKYIRYCGTYTPNRVDCAETLMQDVKYTIIDLKDFLCEDVSEKDFGDKPVIEQLQELADELNEANHINWSDYKQNKFYIVYDFDCKKLDTKSYYNCNIRPQGCIHCTNENFLDIAKKRIGEEKLLSLFGVEKEDNFIEPKVGQLYKIKRKNHDELLISRFDNNSKDWFNNTFSRKHGYEYCKPLKKEEIKAYAEKAEV